MASDIDVFLSHSGKPEKFVRQLHRDLTREHVSCFFDEDRNSLPRADKFPHLIFKAAETCKIAVVVLSKEFVNSKWPMQELSAFVKAKKSGKNVKLILLPIFFMINPNELSNLLKDNPEWEKLEESDVRIGDNGNEVDLRDEVVKKICSILRGIKNPMLLEFKPVGIEKQMLEVEALLDMEGIESALAIIVYGFGGIGKSTLARSSSFATDKTSHIINL